MKGAGDSMKLSLAPVAALKAPNFGALPMTLVPWWGCFIAAAISLHFGDPSMKKVNDEGRSSLSLTITLSLSLSLVFI